MYVCMYVYVYTHRERERERERKCVSVCTERTSLSIIEGLRVEGLWSMVDAVLQREKVS